MSKQHAHVSNSYSEVFHSRTSDEAIMAKERFSEFTEAMITAIPPDTELNMRDKLESLYRYAN